MNDREIEAYIQRQEQMTTLERYGVVEIPIEGTSFYLYIHNEQWDQEGIAPDEIIGAGFIKDINLSFLLLRDYGGNEYLAELKDILESIVANTSDSTIRLAESGLDIIDLLTEKK